MRISIQKDDPGYCKYSTLVLAWRVTLDGKDVRYVFTADEELGIVIVAKRNAEGGVMTSGDEIETEELHGIVKITRACL